MSTRGRLAEPLTAATAGSKSSRGGRASNTVCPHKQVIFIGSAPAAVVGSEASDAAAIQLARRLLHGAPVADANVQLISDTAPVPGVPGAAGEAPAARVVTAAVQPPNAIAPLRIGAATVNVFPDTTMQEMVEMLLLSSGVAGGTGGQPIECGAAAVLSALTSGMVSLDRLQEFAFKVVLPASVYLDSRPTAITGTSGGASPAAPAEAATAAPDAKKHRHEASAVDLATYCTEAAMADPTHPLHLAAHAISTFTSGAAARWSARDPAVPAWRYSRACMDAVALLLGTADTNFVAAGAATAAVAVPTPATPDGAPPPPSAATPAPTFVEIDATLSEMFGPLLRRAATPIAPILEHFRLLRRQAWQQCQQLLLAVNRSQPAAPPAAPFGAGGSYNSYFNSHHVSTFLLSHVFPDVDAKASSVPMVSRGLHLFDPEQLRLTHANPRSGDAGGPGAAAASAIVGAEIAATIASLSSPCFYRLGPLKAIVQRATGGHQNKDRDEHRRKQGEPVSDYRRAVRLPRFASARSSEPTIVAAMETAIAAILGGVALVPSLSGVRPPSHAHYNSRAPLQQQGSGLETNHGCDTLKSLMAPPKGDYRVGDALLLTCSF